MKLINEEKAQGNAVAIIVIGLVIVMAILLLDWFVQETARLATKD